MNDLPSSAAPESYEEMTEGQREDWHRARSNLASERPNARIELRAKFAAMSVEDRRQELEKASNALEQLDDAALIGDSHEEDPFDRDYRIQLEETVRLLTSDPELGVG